MNRRLLAVLAFGLVTILAGSAAHGADTAPSTAHFGFWYVLSVAESTDAAYTAAFGATSIQGRLNSGILFNGVVNTNAKYANLKFYKPSLLPDYDGVRECARKAVTVAATALQLGPSNPTGANAQLIVKVTGDVRLNEGNGGYEGNPDLTIIEVRSLKSIACEASFYFPDRP